MNRLLVNLLNVQGKYSMKKIEITIEGWKERILIKYLRILNWDKSPKYKLR